MGRYVIARSLSGKKVIGSDGKDIGRVIDFVIEEDGKIKYIVVNVNPDSKYYGRLYGEGDDAYIPFEALMSIEDYVIIDIRKLKFREEE